MSPSSRSPRAPIHAIVAASFVVAPIVAGAPRAAAAPTPPLPHRPLVAAFATVDYAALPLLERSAFASCTAMLRIASRDSHRSLKMTPAAPADWRVSGLPADASLRVGSTSYGAAIPHSLVNNLFSAPLRQDLEAEWVVLERGRTTAERAAVSRCAGTARIREPFGASTIEKGEAAAIVPGRVYAYRRCTQGCDQPLGSEARVEELGVVTSPALFVASSGWSSGSFANKDSFSRGSATVRAGATATIVIGLPRSDGAALDPLRSPNPAADADTIDVEVVWPVGGEPSMTVFTGVAVGAAKDLAPAPF